MRWYGDSYYYSSGDQRDALLSLELTIINLIHVPTIAKKMTSVFETYWAEALQSILLAPNP